MKILQVLLVITIWFGAVNVQGQVSLVGGANLKIPGEQPLNKIRYFGGVEVKVGLSDWFKLYTMPQYGGLADGDQRMESVMLPIGYSFQINRMWDEKTPLFRLVDVNLGAFGSYIFMARLNDAETTDEYGAINYGVQLSAKFRLFVFIPVYVSYNYGIGAINFPDEGGYNQTTLQAGIYLPVSHWLKYY